jgi:TonB family protein
MDSLLLPFIALALAATPQTRQPIDARDGDVIRMDSADRVRIVRRSDGQVRAVFNQQQKWLVVLVDGGSPASRTPDGRPDWVFTFDEVTGDWPLGERWDGSATVEEYLAVGEFGTVGLRLITPIGTVQVLNGLRRDESLRDPATPAVMFRGGGRSNGAASFAQAEAQAAANATRSVEQRANRGAGAFSSGVTLTIDGVAATAPPSQPPPPPSAPVRVGGTIKTPLRIQDAAPVLPPVALQAGVRGVVIVEIIIATDGSVSDVKVLRSIPLLDQAAIAAARQWRYEPTYLNGAPIPVIMTATVDFR